MLEYNITANEALQNCYWLLCLQLIACQCWINHMKQDVSISAG